MLSLVEASSVLFSSYACNKEIDIFPRVMQRNDRFVDVDFVIGTTVRSTKREVASFNPLTSNLLSAIAVLLIILSILKRYDLFEKFHRFLYYTKSNDSVLPD